jgi:hypothetical protein
MSNESKWLFFTVGLGSRDFEESAQRLASQASTLNLFSEVKAFTTSEVIELCPRLSTWYSIKDLPNIKGFGWYTWKSKIADLVVREKILGDFDGYMYLDSGCEIFPSYFSKKRLQSMMSFALSNGATLFTIPTPEVWHTKKDVLSYFPNYESNLWSNQIQSGSWLLKSGEVSSQLTKKWEEIAAMSPEMTNEDVSRGGELPDFKVHRYDQSIFSLVCKDMSLKVSNHVIPGSNQSVKYLIRAFSYPFWWSRNRTGTSVVPVYIRNLGLFTLRILERGK